MRKMIGPRWYDFTMGEYCLADLVDLCDKMTALVDKGRAVLHITQDHLVGRDL